MTRLSREHLGDMSTEGERVHARRERLGMGKKELATEAGVNRNTLAAIEAGESFNRTTLAKIERALDSLETEAGFDAPPPAENEGPRDRISFNIFGEGGFHVVVEGATADADLLRRQVTEMIREIRRESD